MKRWLPILASLFLSPSVWAQTTVYTYTGNVLFVSNYTPPCGTGPCANYPSGAHWTGQFTTASPLPSNLSTYTDVTSQVTSFSFSDGLNVFSDSNPNMRVGFFFVETDAGGNIIVADIGGSLWQSGSSPHSGTDRVAFMQIDSPDYAYNNGTCSLIGVSHAGVPDSCKTLPTVDASTSFGSQGTPGLWSKSTGAAPALVSAVSRKAHGSAGTFDLPLSLVPTAPTTEPRQGPAQTIVFTFDKPLNAATVNVTEGAATAAAPSFSVNDVVVGLTGVSNQQYVTVSLTNVNSSDGGTGGNGTVRVGFLVGDVNQSRVVSIADLGLVNAQLAQPVTAANYLKDVNASGTVSLADKGITNANLTKALPPP